MNIVDRIAAENKGRATRLALTGGEDRITYGELLDSAAKWRKALRAAGVRPGERVVLLCEDSIDYVCLALGILASGAALAPVSPSLSFEETQPTMEYIDASWLVYDDSLKMEAPAKPLPQNGGSALEGPSRSLRFRIVARAARGHADEAFKRCDPAFVRFSSGTTGASKGVVLSHRAIHERTEAADRVLRIGEEDRIPWVLSMSFHFVVTILLFLRRGARVMLCGKDFPGALVRMLTAGKASLLYASPFHYDLMTATRGLEASMFSNIRHALSTAMPLSSDTAARFEKRFGLPLCQAYGIIEVGLPFIQSPREARKTGSVGKLGQAYEMRLLEPDAQGIGEVLLRGKGLFSAYFHPWRLRRDIDPEGWFHTGDLGRVDDEGFLFLMGRKREVINFAGMKIFPAEVESVLNSHPSVREAQVVGEAHERFGQCPLARIVPVGPSCNERDLRRFCYTRLAPYQVPKRFELVASIEKTASGKVKRTS